MQLLSPSLASQEESKLAKWHPCPVAGSGRTAGTETQEVVMQKACQSFLGDWASVARHPSLLRPLGSMGSFLVVGHGWPQGTVVRETPIMGQSERTQIKSKKKRSRAH